MLGWYLKDNDVFVLLQLIFVEVFQHMRIGVLYLYHWSICIIKSKVFNHSVELCGNQVEENLNFLFNIRFLFQHKYLCETREIIFQSKNASISRMRCCLERIQNITMNKIKNMNRKLLLEINNNLLYLARGQKWHRDCLFLIQGIWFLRFIILLKLGCPNHQC